MLRVLAGDPLKSASIYGWYEIRKVSSKYKRTEQDGKCKLNVLKLCLNCWSFQDVQIS